MVLHAPARVDSGGRGGREIRGANVPVGWEYSQGQGDTWVGVHYGEGLVDNWAGYVYSASGKSPEAFPKALFHDQITSCSRLASRWFICGFT